MSFTRLDKRGCTAGMMNSKNSAASLALWRPYCLTSALDTRFMVWSFLRVKHKLHAQASTMLAGAADTFVSPLSATSCNPPSFDTQGYELIVGVSCLLCSPCYTEKAPNAWHRRGTPKKKQETPTINPIGPTDKPHRPRTKHYRKDSLGDA